ncbi:hypothetical protein WME94_34265 [Sorangium sp. So ce429]
MLQPLLGWDRQDEVFGIAGSLSVPDKEEIGGLKRAEPPEAGQAA